VKDATSFFSIVLASFFTIWSLFGLLFRLLGKPVLLFYQYHVHFSILGFDETIGLWILLFLHLLLLMVPVSLAIFTRRIELYHVYLFVSILAYVAVTVFISEYIIEESLKGTVQFVS
jgi:hypothetical protein